MAAANSTNREIRPHPSGQGTAANTGGTPATVGRPGNPDTRRPQGSWATTTPTNRDPLAHRSAPIPAANPDGISSGPTPHPDANTGSMRPYSSSTTSTTTRGTKHRQENRRRKDIIRSQQREFTDTGQSRPARDRTKEELHRTRAKLQQLDSEFRRMKTDNANMNRACYELDSENRRHKETIRILQHELTNTVRELQEYKNLSDIRGKKLVGAQAFLTKADLLSIPDVKEKVDALNDENFQVSVSLGDSLIHHKYELPTLEKKAAYAEASRAISGPLTRALIMEAQKPEPEINPLLVQVILEMYLANFCSSKIEPWFPGNRETSDFLTTIYTEIRRTGEFIIIIR